jgi:hypothetical protein
MSNTNNHNIGIVTSQPSIFNRDNSLIYNNSEFASLDKANGDDFVAQAVGGAVGAGVNIYVQYKRNGDSLTLDNINWTELGVNTITGAWSGGASSIGGAIIRGGVASGTTETYNQVEYNKNGVDVNVILDSTKTGALTGAFIGGMGSIGNQIIIKSNQIGQPLSTGVKTYKFPAETAAGITGAVAPQIPQSKDRNND